MNICLYLTFLLKLLLFGQKNNKIHTISIAADGCLVYSDDIIAQIDFDICCKFIFLVMFAVSITCSLPDDIISADAKVVHELVTDAFLFIVQPVFDTDPICSSDAFLKLV